MTATIFLVTFEHKHGTDITAYTTREGALQAGAELVSDYIDEITAREDRDALREQLRLGTAEGYQGAISDYSEMHPYDCITISASELHTSTLAPIAVSEEGESDG